VKLGDRPRRLKLSPYARIRAAALAGRGLHLSAEDVEDLYDLDRAIRTRADMDAAGVFHDQQVIDQNGDDAPF
jgi:hypothetical protein